MNVPARIAWAVEVLAPSPGETVLDVGCGPGVSTCLICGRLGAGRVLALDRSATAIERTTRRNAEHLAARRLELRVGTLAGLVVPAGSFDAALAVDVNLFWATDAAAELRVLARALRPGGRLCLLWGAGGPTSAQRIVRPVAELLAEAGWADVTPHDGAVGIGVVARRA